MTKSARQVANEVIESNIAGGFKVENFKSDFTFEEIGLTSFGLMKSLFQIEKELGSRFFTTSAIRDMKTLNDLYLMIESS